MSIWGRLLGGAAGFALGGPIKEFIEQSNKELAAINFAYDKIKEIRAIS